MPHGTLIDLASLPGMPSLPTLRKIIREHRDFPVIDPGRRGRPFTLDLDQAAAFILQLKAGPMSSEAERQRFRSEHGLEMGGGDHHG